MFFNHATTNSKLTEIVKNYIKLYLDYKDQSKRTQKSHDLQVIVYAPIL